MISNRPKNGVTFSFTKLTSTKFIIPYKLAQKLQKFLDYYRTHSKRRTYFPLVSP